MRIGRRLKQLVGATCRVTTHPDHATEIVRQHPDYDGYIAVGGDGTVSEVVNGLGNKPKLLAIIPDGTCNDLALDLDLGDPNAGLDALKDRQLRKLDVVAIRFRRREQWHERTMI